MQIKKASQYWEAFSTFKLNLSILGSVPGLNSTARRLKESGTSFWSRLPLNQAL